MLRIVVILPTSTYRAGEFIRASEELGVELIVASEGEPPIEMGDRYITIDCSDIAGSAERIVAFADHSAVDGVVAADDSGVVIAAIAGQKLGLPANDPDAAGATRDKAIMRGRLGAGEVPQPRWSPLDASEDPHRAADAVSFPLVLKPLSLSAGQGVIKVDRPEDLVAAVARARSIVAAAGGRDRGLLVEEFMEGAEVAVEGLVASGSLVTLAIFDKSPGPGGGDGFQETILVTPSRHGAEVRSEILRVAAQAVQALGLTHGPVHIELMVSGPRVRIIEVAGRSIGGLCSRSLSFGLMDTTLESLILRNAIGRDKPELRRSAEASGVLMIPIPAAGELVGFSGLDEVKEWDTVTGVEITARPGESVAPPPDGGRYIGFVFASAPAPETVAETLRRAMDTIEVIVE